MTHTPKYLKISKPDYVSIRKAILSHADYCCQNFGYTDLIISYNWKWGIFNFHGLKSNCRKSCYNCKYNLFPHKKTSYCWLPRLVLPFSDIELYTDTPRRMVCKYYDR